MMSALNPAQIHIIAGPTASGKTGLGIRLAQTLAGQGRSAAIINMDSMQLYEGLPILTAQPDAEERAQAPHLLYNILPPGDACSAARYADMAAATIRELQSQNITPILVGGTGLYLKVLLEGIASIPAIDDDIRADARALQAEIGTPALHARLAQVDADAAATLKPGDTQRVIRAWEVYRQTGTPISQWQRAQQAPVIAADAWRGIVLMPQRAMLYDKINRRFHLMVEQGVLAEVQNILDRNLDPALPAMKAAGLPELAQHLRGAATLEAAIAKAQQVSRNYAKRQTTWFTNQLLAKYKQTQVFEGFGGDFSLQNYG